MKTIHKYAVEPGSFTLELPIGSQVLTVQMQGGNPVLWALIDTEQPLMTVHFETVGTGWEIGGDLGHEGMPYVGTFQTGGLVLHVFGGNAG